MGRVIIVNKISFDLTLVLQTGFSTRVSQMGQEKKFKLNLKLEATAGKGEGNHSGSRTENGLPTAQILLFTFHQK